MATALAGPFEEASFENEISKAKKEIETRFRELIDCLRERERILLNELEEILNSYKRERDKQKQSIAELEKVLNYSKETFQSNDLKQFQDSIVKQITEKRKEFESELKSRHLILDFDKTVLALAATVGKLTVTDSTSVVPRLPVADYKGKVTPVLRVGGTAGSEEGQFYNPFGVAVHYQTGNIYVGEQSNNRVQVFDKDGKYLSKFGDRDGAGKMKKPLCIAFYQNKIFVTQGRAGCLFVYDLNGAFDRQVGTPGNGEGQLNRPHGIAINESNGDIFVCDYGNNRVEIFSKDFLFKSQLGQGTLKSPTDIKLTNESIYVLSLSNPFLYSFNYDLTPSQNAVPNSISNQLKRPYAFCVDGGGNFIVSDYDRNSIAIFNRQGELVHRISDSVQSPTGVTLDARGRIILVGFNHRLLIF